MRKDFIALLVGIAMAYIVGYYMYSGHLYQDCVTFAAESTDVDAIYYMIATIMVLILISWCIMVLFFIVSMISKYIWKE